MFHLNSMIDWVWPPQCVHCRREGAWLCPDAARAIENEPVLVNPISLPGVDRVITRATYDCAPLARLIQQLKYHYWTGLTPILGHLMMPVREQLPIGADAVIVPVPLHRRRQRQRGFNQAELVSQALSEITGWPLEQTLQRSRYTKPQAKLTATLRTTNLLGAFRNQRVVKWPHSAILVDDVITTGSTIAECASVLRRNGTNQIVAVALAKG